MINKNPLMSITANEKLISIIIATYNAQETLQTCLSSIAPQKSEEVELLIIDGGSLDFTAEIVKDNMSIVDKFIVEKDKGIYDAWNKGIRLSTGKWIMFIGADDTLLPAAISNYIEVVKSLNDEELDFICARNEYVNKDGKILKVIGKKYCWNEYRRTMQVAHVASLHSNQLFNDVGLFEVDLKICADYELLMRKKDNLKSYFLNERIARMRIGGTSFSRKAVFEAFLVRKRHNSINSLFNIILLISQYILYLRFKYLKWQ